MTNVEGREGYLNFVSKQVLLVDPRQQGFGLQNYGFLDAYANKFFILAGSGGTFVSPREMPPSLLDYYGDLGIDIPTPDNILN